MLVIMHLYEKRKFSFGLTKVTDDEKFSRLIGTLYEAVMAPELWTEALELCAEYVGAVGTHLLTLNKDRGDIELSLFGGGYMSELNVATYTGYYMHIDPRMTLGMMDGAAVHEWRSCHHYLDKTFVARNEFYQDCLIPMGGRYSMGAWVDDNANNHTLLGLHRAPKQHSFDEQSQAMAMRFSPHLQRALQLLAHTQQLRNQAAHGANALDANTWAAFIVDRHSRVLHLNENAERLLATAKGQLSYQSGKLMFSDTKHSPTFVAAIHAATSEYAMGQSICFSNNPIKVAFVTPLKASLNLVSDWQKPLALVLIKASGEAKSPICSITQDAISKDKFEADFTHGKPDALERFALTYKLTQKETEVLQALSIGLSAREVAKQRGVSFNTVRTQITSVLQKTGCKRQMDLIRLFLTRF